MRFSFSFCLNDFRGRCLKFSSRSFQTAAAAKTAKVKFAIISSLKIQSDTV